MIDFIMFGGKCCQSHSQQEKQILTPVHQCPLGELMAFPRRINIEFRNFLKGKLSQEEITWPHFRGPSSPWGRWSSAEHQKGTAAVAGKQCQQGGKAARGTHAAGSVTASTVQTAWWAAASWLPSRSACCCRPAPSRLGVGRDNSFNFQGILNPLKVKKQPLLLRPNQELSTAHLVDRCARKWNHVKKKEIHKQRSWTNIVAVIKCRLRAGCRHIFFTWITRSQIIVGKSSVIIIAGVTLFGAEWRGQQHKIHTKLIVFTPHSYISDESTLDQISLSNTQVHRNSFQHQAFPQRKSASSAAHIALIRAS